MRPSQARASAKVWWASGCPGTGEAVGGGRGGAGCGGGMEEVADTCSVAPRAGRGGDDVGGQLGERVVFTVFIGVGDTENTASREGGSRWEGGGHVVQTADSGNDTVENG